VIQLQAKGLTVAPIEDGETGLEVGSLLLVGHVWASADESFARDAAENGFERRQEVKDRLLRRPTDKVGEHGQLHHRVLLAIVLEVVKLSSVVAAEKLGAADVHQALGLAVELLAGLVVVEQADAAVDMLGRDGHGRLLVKFANRCQLAHPA
jgi:hypothetical protein